MLGIHKSSQIRLTARITSISGRQCPAGCDDEEVLARAPSIFGLVIGMSRHRPTADVLHLTDEVLARAPSIFGLVAKRENRERMNNIDLETWPRHRNTSSAGSREDELIELKRFQEQLSKRSVNHQRFPRRFQPPQRRASPAVGGDKKRFQPPRRDAGQRGTSLANVVEAEHAHS